MAPPDRERRRIRVGISGWSYPAWRGDFYPRGLRQADELAYAAERMSAIEINGSFYSLQRASSYAGWRAAAPADDRDFVFTVKGGRFITHMKKLKDAEQPLANFFASGLLALGPRLGAVLWQLPANLAFDPDRVAAFFDLLPRSTSEMAALAAEHDDKVPEPLTEAEADVSVRHVLEYRHESFGSEEALDLMRQHGVGCVVADTAGEFPQADAVTSDVVYVRLHGDTELYASGYTDEALDAWAERSRSWAEGADVFVFFDNDAKGHAPHDALRLRERLGV